MSGQGNIIGDATKGVNRRGNFYDTSRKHGGGKGLNQFGTGFSSVVDGNVTIDPSIRALQEEYLTKNRSLYDETGRYGDEVIGNSRGLRNRFLGNQSEYMESQLNPIRQQIETRRGELQRNNSLRGISGSSFGDQSLNNFETDSGRALRDARSQTEFEQLNALTGIDAQLTQQMFQKVSGQAKLNGENLEVSKLRLQQELSALGIGIDNIKLIAGLFESQQNRSFQERKAIADNISSYFGGGGKQQKTEDPNLGSEEGSSGSEGGGSSEGSKIACTAMNELYGFGSYRNKIWLKYAKDNLTKNHEKGYHAIFLPLVKFGFKSGNGLANIIVRKTLEHIARHRSVDLRAVMRGGSRDGLGILYRSILEPICYIVGCMRK